MESHGIASRPLPGPQALVVYHSVYGNTRLLAETVAETLGSIATVRLLAAHGRLDIDVTATDLLVLGLPTQRHGVAERASMFLSRLEHRRPAGLRVAIFDTRYRMPRLVSGSAGHEAEHRLRRVGCEIVVPAQSFFIERLSSARGAPVGHRLERLEPSELARAAEWAADLAGSLRRGSRPAA